MAAQGWGRSSVVESVPGVCEALGLITTVKIKKFLKNNKF